MCMKEKFWEELAAAHRPSGADHGSERFANAGCAARAPRRADPGPGRRHEQKEPRAEWLEMFDRASYRSRRSTMSRRHSPIRSLPRPWGWCNTVPHPAKPRLQDALQSAQDRRRPARADRCARRLGADNEALLGPGQPKPRPSERGMKLDGHQGRRPLGVPARAISHHDARRSRRRGDQGRAAGRGRSRAPHRPVGRPVHRLLPQRQSRQEERRHRPQDRPKAAKACSSCARAADVFVEILPAGRSAAARCRLRDGGGAQSAHRLLLDQRLRPGRPLSRPAGARPRHHGPQRRA